jgi:hypothetical protein
MLSAPVPRNLRVRSSIQLSSTRVPARAFLIVAGLVFVGGLLIVAGADLMPTVRIMAALIVASLVVFELRCWGRSVPEVVRILARHYRRPRQLRLTPLMVVLPTEIDVVAVRRPRWQTER